MKTFLKISDKTFNVPTDEEASGNLKIRDAARAVVVSSKGEVYLLRVTKYNAHKLPGGAIERGEKPDEAVLREVLEETGCKSKIIKSIGLVIEHKFTQGIEQRSHCYVVEQTGERGEQALEEGEIEVGHELVIAKNIHEAILILENDVPKNLLGKYIKHRELALLKESSRLMY